MNTVIQFKATWAAILAILTALWGWWGWLIVLWILSMGLDYASGTMKAKRSGTWSSDVAREGLWHKATEVLAVIAALILDVMIQLVLPNIPGVTVELSYGFLIVPLVCAWYILTELGSVMENIAEMGGRIPEFFKNAIQNSKEKIDKTGEALTPGKVQFPTAAPPVKGDTLTAALLDILIALTDVQDELTATGAFFMDDATAKSIKSATTFVKSAASSLQKAIDQDS